MKRRNCICTNSKRFIILLFVISTLLYTTLLNNSLSGRILDATVIHDQDLSTKSEDQPIEKEKELDSAINKFINHHSLSEKLATTKSNLLRVSLMKESAKIEDMLIQKEVISIPIISSSISSSYTTQILVKPNAPSKNTLKKSPLVKMIEHLTYKDQSNLLNPHDIALVTYWVPQINNEARVHFEESIYTKIADISLTNIAKYAHQQGIYIFLP